MRPQREAVLVDEEAGADAWGARGHSTGQSREVRAHVVEYLFGVPGMPLEEAGTGWAVRRSDR